MSTPTPFRIFLIHPWHAAATKLHSHLDDGVEHVPGVIAAIQDAADIHNARKPAFPVEIVLDENMLRPGGTILEQLYVALQQCDLSVVILDGLRPNVVLEYGMILGMLRVQGEQGKRVIAIHASDATVLVRNYYPEATQVPSFDGVAARILNPLLNIERHLSDIAGLFVHRYDRHQPIKTIRQWFLNFFSKELASLAPPRGTVSTDQAIDESPADPEGAPELQEQEPDDVWQLYRAGDYEAIINNTSVNNNPRHLQALALAYMKSSRIHDAMRIWKRLESQTAEDLSLPNDSPFAFTAKLHLGICHYVLGQHTDAVRYLEAAKALAATEPAKDKVDKWEMRAKSRLSGSVSVGQDTAQ